MDYFIGMDGGGTKTRAKIVDIHGNVLGTFDGGSSNINSLSIDMVSNNILSLLSSSVIKLNLQPSCCKGICIGSAGMGREDDRVILESAIKKLFPTKVLVVDDAFIMSSACKNAGDIILIAGTGSICYGLKSDKSFSRMGGWGHIIGDEAGAYFIAVNMLRSVMYAYDGRGEKTILTELVFKHLGIDKEEDLIPYVYRSGNGKKEIAGIAKLLSDACNMGDIVSMVIAVKSGMLLADLVDDMHKKLKQENSLSQNDMDDETEGFSVILNGSIIKNNTYIRQSFEKYLYDKYPLIDIKDYEQDAADGAVKLLIDYVKSK